MNSEALLYTVYLNTTRGIVFYELSSYLRKIFCGGYVLIAVYLFVCLSVCYSHNSKSIKPNRMKFGALIGYYTGTI